MDTLPARIGPYRVVSLLGSGGQGVVYQALAPDNTLCALKTLSAPSAPVFFRLRCEIHALSQLSHPGIIQILAHDAEGGVPWYAMELITGGSLRRFCLQPPQSPAELLERLTLFSQLSDTLAFLHGEGFLHLDLKPENILLRSGTSPSPVLADFGLASILWSEVGRDTLSAPSTTSGTPAYAAPEQIKQHATDTRTDLYALGCILYHLVTGAPPFVGTPRQVLLAHLHQAPLPPSALVPWLPQPLDALTLSLLQKSPTKRPGYAEDVAAQLVSLGVPRHAGWPRPRPHLYRPRFVGREAPWAALQAALSLLETNPDLELGSARSNALSSAPTPRPEGPGLLLIEGEGGVGKTRVALELSRDAERRGLAVCASECVQGQQGEGLSSLRPLLRHLADHCRSQGAQVLGARGSILALYEPSLLEFCHGPPPAELPSEASRLRLFVYLAESLVLLSQEQPLLVILDDLQWADPLSLAFLQHLVNTNALAGAALLFCGFSRSEDRPALLEAIALQHPQRLLSLARLDAESVRQIAHDMLALAPPQALLDSLHKTTEGNPYFIAEYLRVAVEGGLLARSTQGAWRLSGPLPEYPTGLTALIEQRVGALQETERQVLSLAAVLGREFLSEWLTQLSPEDLDLMAALRSLIRRRILGFMKTNSAARPTQENAGRLRFSHDLLRQLVYQRLPEDQRVSLHHKIASLLSTSAPASVLGVHWEAARETVRAKACYLEGARQAAARYDLDAAAQLYRAYLSLHEPAVEAEATIKIELARRVLFYQGAFPEAQALLQETRAIPSLLPLSLEGLAEIARAQSRLPEAQRLYEEALDLYVEQRDPNAEARVCVALLPLLIDQGLLPAFASRYETVQALCLSHPNPALEAQTIAYHARLCWIQGRLDEALRLYKSALALQEGLGDRVSQGMYLANIAGLSYNLGDIEGAERSWRDALRIHQEVGNKRNEGISLGNLAAFFQEQGRSDEAQQTAQAALLIHRQVGNRRSLALLQERMATWHQEAGDFESALSGYQATLRLLAQNNDRVYQPYTLLQLAILTRRMGDYTRAAHTLSEAEALLVALEDKLGLLEVACQRGHLALSQGEPASPYVEAALLLAPEQTDGAKSYMQKSIQALQTAMSEHAGGKVLLQGEAPRLLPSALKRRMRDPSRSDQTS